ncbi:hypothetical protein BDE02_01G342600 [Populus trichocarpa]|nr:hypothetical protein BDE02_01G342600 [Populus trichocarpa]
MSSSTMNLIHLVDQTSPSLQEVHQLPHKHAKNQRQLWYWDYRIVGNLEAEGDDTLVVTLVPRTGGDSVTVANVKIELSLTDHVMRGHMLPFLFFSFFLRLFVFSFLC